MRIKLGQDLVTGLLFIVIGIGSILTILLYDKLSMGTANRPGTGVLPMILSGLLIFTGGLLGVKSMLGGDTEVSNIPWKPLIMTTIGITLFGILIDGAVLNFGFFKLPIPSLGLILSAVIGMTICAYGIDETRWGEFFKFLVILLVLSWATFVCLLGMPVSTCPAATPCEVCWIIKKPFGLVLDLINWMVR